MIALGNAYFFAGVKQFPNAKAEHIFAGISALGQRRRSRSWGSI
jgi:hypothetical protein